MAVPPAVPVQVPPGTGVVGVAVSSRPAGSVLVRRLFGAPTEVVLRTVKVQLNGSRMFLVVGVGAMQARLVAPVLCSPKL